MKKNLKYIIGGILAISIVIGLWLSKKSKKVFIASSGSDADYSNGSPNFDHKAVANALYEEFRKFNSDEDMIISILTNGIPKANDLKIISDLFGTPNKDYFSWQIGEFGRKATLKEFTKGTLNNKEWARVARKFAEAEL